MELRRNYAWIKFPKPFNFLLVPLGKTWIHRMSDWWYVNSRVDCSPYPLFGNQSSRMKTLNSNQLYSNQEVPLCHILTVVERRRSWVNMKLRRNYAWIRFLKPSYAAKYSGVQWQSPNHHHQGALTSLISLNLSLSLSLYVSHSLGLSLSSIGPGRSSKLHPVSVQSWYK